MKAPRTPTQKFNDKILSKVPTPSNNGVGILVPVGIKDGHLVKKLVKP